MLLAAGEGQRLRPITKTCPKPLVAVGGVPLIVRLIGQLRDAGFHELVINTCYLADQVESALGDGGDLGVQIVYSRENELLETGGGIVKMLDSLGTVPFAVVSADVYTDFDFGLLPETLDDGVLGHLVLVDNPVHHPEGDFGRPGPDGRIQVSHDKLTYAGISALHPGLFEGCSESSFPLRDLLFPAVAAGALSGMHYDGLWSDVGTPESLAELESRIVSKNLE